MSDGGPGAEAAAGTPSKRRKPTVLALGDGGYAERVAAGKERMVGIRAALRERSVGMCAANNLGSRAAWIYRPRLMPRTATPFMLTSLAATTLIFCAPSTR